ncbi:MAG TPA: hypothetical protein VHB02_12285 [Acidimicrobiales bacterium]|nr:hypothetical protein [Acidimicrobiales bacterium]
MPRRRQPHRPFALDGSHWRADGRPKVRYGTQGEALSVAEERAREAGTDLTVYRCEFCGGWHMGRRGGRDED